MDSAGYRSPSCDKTSLQLQAKEIKQPVLLTHAHTHVLIGSRACFSKKPHMVDDVMLKGSGCGLEV